MKKNDLNKVYCLKREIELIEKQVKEYEELATSVTSSTDNEPVQSGCISDKIGQNASVAADLQVKLKQKLQELTIERMRLLNIILTVDDALLRRILEERCLNTKTWVAVSMAIGGNNTADSCRKMYKRYIDKIN